MSHDPPLSPSQILALILNGLRKAATDRGARVWAFGPIVLILWPYLHRVAARFDSLSRRLQNARVRKTAAGEARNAGMGPRKPQLPRGFNWLGRLGPDIRVYRGQLEHLFRQPEMRAILAASPQANRMLRPLCRMLGIAAAPDLPSTLFTIRPAKPPPAPRPAAIARPERLRPPRPPRPKCDPSDWWMPKSA